VQVFGYLEDEWCFSSWKTTMHLDVCSKVFTLENFPYDSTIEEWKTTHSQYAIDVYFFFFDIGKQHLYFVIGSIGKKVCSHFPTCLLIWHLLHFFGTFISILKSY
jgi:hypothetical protein